MNEWKKKKTNKQINKSIAPKKVCVYKKSNERNLYIMYILCRQKNEQLDRKKWAPKTVNDHTQSNSKYDYIYQPFWQIKFVNDNNWNLTIHMCCLLWLKSRIICRYKHEALRTERREAARNRQNQTNGDTHTHGCKSIVVVLSILKLLQLMFWNIVIHLENECAWKMWSWIISMCFML